MKATARPSPSAITQALVPYPPRERPRASRVSRSAEEPLFERPRLLSGGRGCWCRPETSSRVGRLAPGPEAAAAPTRLAQLGHLRRGVHGESTDFPDVLADFGVISTEV